MNANPPPVPEPPPAPDPAPRVWTTLDLINWTKGFFEKKGLDHPRLEAELLLCEALGCPRIRLYVDFEKPVSADHLATFRDFVKRRGEKREPLQYIVGHTQFIDLQIKVTPAALIPRPETEILAVWAVDRLKEAHAKSSSVPRVLDLCTGTGCVALYSASKIPDATVIATDISTAALTLARENAVALKLDARVEFLEGDLFGALNESHKSDGFDVIVTNPPYIDETTRTTLQPEVRDYEPASALFAAEGGVAISRRIIEMGASWLKPYGWLGLEFGAGQQEIIREIATATGNFADIQIEKDGAKLPRFLMARKK
jgi:release factor glutamine methyltransferase